MALCRCEDHPPQNNRKYHYTHYAHPKGYPDTSSICGIKGCFKPGYIYLAANNDHPEVDYFREGIRIFAFFRSYETKVRVEDELFPI